MVQALQKTTAIWPIIEWHNKAPLWIQVHLSWLGYAPHNKRAILRM
jgi:hypothetical protein